MISFCKKIVKPMGSRLKRFQKLHKCCHITNFFLTKIRNNCEVFLNKLIPKKIYLGRVACVGHQILEMKLGDEKKIQFLNIQKGRVDVILDWECGKSRPKADIVKKFLIRKDVFPLIKQQEDIHWQIYKRVTYIIIDSFSDLTDQKFTHKMEGWSFCAHFSDLDVNEKFKDLFFCEGLLEIEKMEIIYQKFFSYLEENFKFKNVIFIHYSPKFDKRLSYHQRCSVIKSILKKLEREKEYLINLYLDENYVEQNETDDFPWHYGLSTIKEFVNQWEQKDDYS